MKPKKNDPCSCGSGKKFKHCCEGKTVPPPQAPAPAEINQLIALYNTRRYGELESSARQLVEQFPSFGFGWQLLGGALQMQGKVALHAFRKTAELMPEDAGAHFNLGVVLKSLGQLDAAAASYRRAVALKPDYAEAHGNLGNVLKDLGQLDAAVTSYRRAVALEPDSAKAHFDLAKILHDQSLLANNQGTFTEAETSYLRALELKPDSAQANFNLAALMQDQNRFVEAEVHYRRTLEIKPDYADAYYNLGIVFQFLGRFDDAIVAYRRTLEIKPKFAEAYDNLLFCLSHSEAVDAATLFSEHRRFGEQFEASLRAHWSIHTNFRDPERVLQIGFVSADLNNHSVAYFIEPVLEQLAGYTQLSLHAYYNHTGEDAVTRRLRGYLKHWHQIANLSDDALAQKIREDGIDILIDLSGHTAKNRLLAFARKPAPIQASWMGYPGTTGLSSMDYYLADHFFLPTEQFASQFTEKLVYLPANVPFLPSKLAPPVNALPALGNGYITFGSFNRSSKISRPVIALWSQLLRALPDSRMLLGAMPEKEIHNTLIEWFVQEGIARERLDIHARSGMESYLSLHLHVDICLDTFPYNGGTTTLHALWMGVPTLTLAGLTVASRSGASILGHVGLESFVAYDTEDFVHKGLSWSNNLAALSEVRAGLRERFASSAIGQPAAVAKGLERALRDMWQRWCAGLPPDVIDTNDK